MSLALLPLLLLGLLPEAHPNDMNLAGSTIYVAPDGNDQWSGGLPSPNPMKTEGPVATLERARAIVRRLLDTPAGKRDTIRVLLRGGTYERRTPFLLDKQDSGTLSMPVCWAAFPGETVRIIGGTALHGFLPVTDTAAARRLPDSVRAQIREADLRGMGISDFGSIAPRGNPGMELFFNGTRMQLARWPNDSWLLIADVPQTGDTLFNKGLEREKRFHGVPVGRHYGRITYSGDRPQGWSDRNEIYLHGYWTWDWSDSFQKAASINTAAREITFAPPHHHYGYTTNQRYYFLNILEELDAPGEWYLDRSGGKLFFNPPGPLDGVRIEVSLLEGPLLQFDSCSHICFRDVSLETSRGKGVLIRGGNGVTIDGCTLRNLGEDAVVVEGGSGHAVLNSEIADVARGGVLLNGGDRASLTPANDVVRNTHIHHYSRWLRTGTYAVILDGVGNRMEHCLVHDAPFEAVYIKGNDHRIEYNEIHSVMRESGDAGAIHTGRNWTWRGNVVRYNYFHDFQGPGLHGVMGMYMDDWASGFTVTGNVFYRAGRATLIGGGRDNVVENNLYVECAPSVHLDARGLGWAKYYFDGTYPVLFDGLKEVHHDVPPYSTRYPLLANMPGTDPAIPRNNSIVRNVSWGGRWMDIYDYLVFDKNVCTIKDNVVADPIVLRRRADGGTGWDPYYLNIDMEEGYLALYRNDARVKGEFPHDVFVNAPPLIFDPVHRTIMVPEDSPARAVGFEVPPLRMMGLLRP